MKVVVAMSGGVDSSVAAALLKKQGCDVIGVFMKFWKETGEGGKEYNRCCSPDSERRARQVAKILGIPFYVFNFEKEFKKKIVDYFLKGCEKGITPNPCVLCNKEIKFGLLLEKTLELGANYAAMGHYVKKVQSSNFKIQKLLAAKDKEKDQSYFLWQLNQEQLKRVLFPIGDYKKSEVRNLAEKFKLPFKKVPESMEICFISKNTEGFLGKYLKAKPGLIVDKKRTKLGKHQGLYFYTIGQRKGIGLSGGPYYVIAKNMKKNELVVSKNEKDLLKKELVTQNVNWISGEEPKIPLKVRVKIRYHSPAVLATICKLHNTKYKILFEKPQRAVTPGQSAVWYQGQELLGGGEIA